MSVTLKLAGVKSIQVSSLNAVVSSVNANFSNLTSALNEFLVSVGYAQSPTVSLNVPGITVLNLRANQSISVYNQNDRVIYMTSTGSVQAKNLVSSDVVEGLRLRLQSYGNLPSTGVPGEIVYVPNHDEYFEGFYGYLETTGWTQLSGGGGGSGTSGFSPAMVMMYVALGI